MTKHLLFTALIMCSLASLRSMQNIQSLEEYTVDHSLDQELIDEIKTYQQGREYGTYDKANLKPIEALLNHNKRPDINVMFKHCVWGFAFRTCTPLIYAATYLDLDMLKLFIKYKANINGKNDTGLTPLLAAIEDGNAFISRFTGWSYSIADEPLQRDVIDTLLKAGAMIKEIDNNGHDALFYAAHIPGLTWLKHVLYQSYAPVEEASLDALQTAVADPFHSPERQVLTTFLNHRYAAGKYNETLHTAQPTIEQTLNDVTAGSTASGNITNIIVDYAQTTPEDIRQQQAEKES